jgi:ADP-ribosyl-[dinitrogen reductase] hydrolase
MSGNSRPSGPPPLHHRVRGCILGGVIGDAMGGPFEGQQGPLRFQTPKNWAISDDSQLTLATCESIIEIGEVSPEHIANHFVDWYRAGRITGMGSSTLKALRDLDAGVHWALAGSKGEMAAGNGSAMRIAPLAFQLDHKVDRDRQLIRDVCRITHHNEEAYVGALAIAIAIRSLAFDGVAPTNLFEAVVRDIPDSRVRDRILALKALQDVMSIAKVAAEFGSSGYVVDSVPLAIFAARSIERIPFDEVIRKVIEAGGDTDTIASMTGQITGAWLGASRISHELIEMLPNAAYIERVADEFARS